MSVQGKARADRRYHFSYNYKPFRILISLFRERVKHAQFHVGSESRADSQKLILTMLLFKDIFRTIKHFKTSVGIKKIRSFTIILRTADPGTKFCDYYAKVSFGSIKMHITLCLKIDACL